MNSDEIAAFNDMSKVNSLLIKCNDFITLIYNAIRESIEYTKSDIGCFYYHLNPRDQKSKIKLLNKIGRYKTPDFFFNGDLSGFIEESAEAVLILNKKSSPFNNILLNQKSNSGIAISVAFRNFYTGILVLNSLNENFYNRKKILFIESLIRLINELSNKYDIIREFELFNNN